MTPSSRVWDATPGAMTPGAATPGRRNRWDETPRWGDTPKAEKSGTVHLKQRGKIYNNFFLLQGRPLVIQDGQRHLGKGVETQ